MVSRDDTRGFGKLNSEIEPSELSSVKFKRGAFQIRPVLPEGHPKRFLSVKYRTSLFQSYARLRQS